MVSTLDFESSDPGSNPGRTSRFGDRAPGPATRIECPDGRPLSHPRASMAQLAERSAVNR